MWTVFDTFCREFWECWKSCTLKFEPWISHFSNFSRRNHIFNRELIFFRLKKKRNIYFFRSNRTVKKIIFLGKPIAPRLLPVITYSTIEKKKSIPTPFWTLAKFKKKLASAVYDGNERRWSRIRAWQECVLEHLMNERRSISARFHVLSWFERVKRQSNRHTPPPPSLLLVNDVCLFLGKSIEPLLREIENDLNLRLGKVY